MFDGALNLQLRGKLLKWYDPKLKVMCDLTIYLIWPPRPPSMLNIGLWCYKTHRRG